MKEIYLGRQPIYNKSMKVEGYELFHRQADCESANFIDSDLATSQVIMNSLAEIGLNKVVGEHKAFINVARNFILSGHLESLVSPQLVFEIVGDIAVDQALLDALHELRRQGQIFALDDYVDNEANRALLEIASYVKIDTLMTSEEEVRRLVALLREQKVALIAECIEDQSIFELCQSLQFDFFQGYHFSQPKLLKFHSVSTNRLVLMQLISKLHDPEASPKTIESLVSQDVSLTYKLLRYINSAYFNLPKRVDSIQRAIVLLGINKIKSWATLISFANVEDTRSDLITIALVRARMCELLAEATGLERKDTCYTAGLLSVLDIMTQCPMEEALKHLSLSEDLNLALTNYEGSLGRILQCALAYERCDWDGIDTLGLEASQISDIYLTALADAYRASYELL